MPAASSPVRLPGTGVPTSALEQQCRRALPGCFLSFSPLCAFKTRLPLYATCLPPPPSPAAACRDRSQPIWVSLSQGRAELYRDILQLELGSSPYLEQ